MQNYSPQNTSSIYQFLYKMKSFSGCLHLHEKCSSGTRSISNNLSVNKSAVGYSLLYNQCAKDELSKQNVATLPKTHHRMLYPPFTHRIVAPRNLWRSIRGLHTRFSDGSWLTEAYNLGISREHLFAIIISYNLSKHWCCNTGIMLK